MTDTTHPQSHYLYLAGGIHSKRTYLYGRFEFRARLPKGKGLCPSILLRTPGNLPTSGEISILEGFGSHPNVVQSTLHSWMNGSETHQYAAWLVVQPKPDSPRFHKEGVERVEHLITLPRDLSEDFHVYGMEWQPEEVVWTFDGVPYFTVRGHVPKEPMELILQLAINPNADGKPDAATPLPQSLDVDYIRIWGDR